MQLTKYGTRSPALTSTSLLLLLALTAAALLIHGYHLGIEDESIYLPAIKQHLDPALYPHDSIMFTPQTQPTLMDDLVAFTIRVTHVTVAMGDFAWHLISMFAFLTGCWLLMSKVFPKQRARLGAVSLITTLLTIPVAGTAIYIADQHLHPRLLATALILFAAYILLPEEEAATISVARMAFSFVVAMVAAGIHVQMAFYGLVFLFFLAIPLEWLGESGTRFAILLALPLASLFQHASPEWLEASRIKRQHYLLNWEWYEWLGIIAPPLILWFLAHVARDLDLPAARRLALRTALLGVFGITVALLLTTPPRLERLVAYQPLRTFLMVYVVMLLLIGGLLAECVLRNHLWRWLVLLLPIATGMYIAQRSLFPGSHHIEWPNRPSGNAWVDAFAWIRQNTPKDAYFALDAHYTKFPGEDYHGFRGLAERSQLADWDKDSGVPALFPALSSRWSREAHAVEGLNNFGDADFERLHRQFGADWTVIAKPIAVAGKGTVGRTNAESRILQHCPYQNAAVYVCKIE